MDRAEREREKRRAARQAAAKKQREAQVKRMRLIIAAAGAVLILVLMLVIGQSRRSAAARAAAASGAGNAGAASGAVLSSGEETAESAVTESGEAEETAAASAPAAAPAQTAAVQVEIPEEIAFEPHATEETEPTVLMDYSEICVDGDVLEDRSLYDPWYQIDFKTGPHYAENVDGIVTFRGNSFRDDPTKGFVNFKEYRFENLWTKSTGVLEYNERTWSGNGWTGQPLMMRWPKDVKQHMNMYEAAKADDDLVEVIYASMDGYIYFMNLVTGEATRDPMFVGWTFKGAGALDPRGYPILYVGAGYNSDKGVSRAFIINLLDCSIMYTFGNEDDFSLRGTLSYFDSSALVDAASDTLIYPGENGILYLMRLNTSYDPAAGTLTVDPDPIVKWHYWGKRTSDEKYWLGMEDSAAIYKNYIFVCDNGGHMMCINLNTLRFAERLFRDDPDLEDRRGGRLGGLAHGLRVLHDRGRLGRRAVDAGCRQIRPQRLSLCDGLDDHERLRRKTRLSRQEDGRYRLGARGRLRLVLAGVRLRARRHGLRRLLLVGRQHVHARRRHGRSEGYLQLRRADARGLPGGLRRVPGRGDERLRNPGL